MGKPIKKIALMAVGDDGWQGGIQYISNIMHALDALAQEHPVEILLFRHSAQNFSSLHDIKHTKVTEYNTEKVYPSWTFPNKVKWFLQRKFSGRINPRMENFLLDLEVDFVFPATLSNCNNKLNAGSWIADFQYHNYPGGANKLVIKDTQQIIQNIAENTEKIVLSSKFCEEECLNLFPGTKGKTFVMPFAVAIPEAELSFLDFESIRLQYELPERFLLVANLFAPTKNHQLLFEALGILKAKGLVVPLVCTGNIVDYRNEHFGNVILQLLTDNKIRSQVYLLGLVPRPHQLAMFRMASAMVQPSVSEGWSTCVEEAKALGKYLFVSDIAVHKEQCGDTPLMFKAMDAQELAGKIEGFWNRTKGVSFPELETESKAMQAYKKNIHAFGLRFLEIAAA